MNYDPSFDPTPYYDIAATNLLANFGEEAFSFADAALKRSKAAGQEESFAMWLGVLDSLVKVAHKSGMTPAVAIH